MLKKSIRKSKEKTTLCVHSRKDFAYGMTDLLELVFWRNPHTLSEPALKFLEMIKTEDGVEDNRWKKACEVMGLVDDEGVVQRGKFDSVIRKLRGMGMIHKDNQVWELSSHFDNFLEQVTRIWRGFKEKNEERRI